MDAIWRVALRKARQVAGWAATAALVASCGGSGEAPADDLSMAAADGTDAQTVLIAVPEARRSAQTAGQATSFKVHYHRLNADYEGWQIHTWGAAQDPGWNNGWNASGTDPFGVVYDVPLVAQSGAVGYLFHKGDWKDHGGADQSYTLVEGQANEIWRIEGDATTYLKNPFDSGPPDITTVRVHYQRFAGDYAAWGLHLWNGSGLDAARLPGVAIDNWNAPVAFGQMPGYTAGGGEIVFDIPVLNPKDDASRTSLEFIIHGMPPNQNDKDGRPNNIQVDYAALTIAGQVGQIWLVEQDATVYTNPPDLRSVSSTDARAVWLTKQLIQWPRVAASGTVRLYHSATGQIVVAKDQAVTGADGFLALDAFTGPVPPDTALRFKYVARGTVFAVRDADLALLPALHTHQLVLVQEDANGKVQNATTGQLAGALDDLYAAAYAVPDLGATVKNGLTTFKLWAPTAQQVGLYLYPNGAEPAISAEAMSFDPATGIWSLSKPGDHAGAYYRFGVRVFVRGVGVVRNLVTDPYSLSLSGDSRRSYVADLDGERLKPAGWDASQPPKTVAVSSDMSIYELHVRDFSANDPSVPEAHRGKYLAFTDSHSNGMKHLKALAAAGLTDVHLLPAFDIASVPEKGCVTPSPSGAPDSPDQQASVAATAGIDCFNWGYDPWHFTAPEGSYASAVGNGATRIVEFRRMVKALNAAGLRVGMDVVYNHTTASGQNDHSVLDKVVPGYYHRLDAAGNIEHSTCCENTATENHMMGKLMIDSVITWARDYHVSSFRFDIMGHQPRSVMEELKAKVKAATGRDVQLIGEGWNFGEVANGQRFVQADMLSLNGSGIGTFNPFVRDAVRGGGCCDSGSALIANQGWVNGLWYDPNELGGGRSKNDLMWLGDIIKAGLAGSIRSYTLTTHWDATLPLEQLNVGGLPAGYVIDPAEVVNYFENHDNQTFFDINAYRLPTTTSKEDRARVQMLGAALNAFAQGVAYFHAGVDTERSKSMDRNSYDAGDWFNRLDWLYTDNNFAVGLPMQRDNGNEWGLIQPRLANPLIKPGAGEIGWTRDVFRDLLKIRASSTLLRLRTADDIKARLKFVNTGSGQEATVVGAVIDGTGYAGANFAKLAYFVNVDKAAHSFTAEALAGAAWQLHPVHLAPNAADPRAKQAQIDSASGSVTVPPRTAVAFVVN
ncbi:alpha-1,6-glucosidase domain-containing protein [Ideonella sp.]|uniref:alpha-1,6-glucosidase domain-containing protein n=1 Tax=Ideonella sp. TaxID=1929293 RepID=UPI002B476B80|nr:alpha-1,6-glucosidase domain-containing protein [Ideonella sp.]HJV68145.1 alpha-1,6-glucosidase domain-containing protein [Ideonella sp.]